MKIIVLAPEDDNHTAPLKWALEKANYRVACWGGLSWTGQGQASVLLGNNDGVTLGGYSVDPGDVVWVRRPEPPQPNPKTSEADKKFASLEYRSLYHSVAYLLESLPVWCINKYSAARAMVQKSVQLQLAHKCGLKIPATLMSNSPQQRQRILWPRAAESSARALRRTYGRKKGITAVAITETFELTSEQLPTDEILTYAPAIYQERVPKEFDVTHGAHGEPHLLLRSAQHQESAGLAAGCRFRPRHCGTDPDPS